MLQSSPYDRATSFEPIRARNPHFAVGEGNRKEFFEAVVDLRAFREAYREAIDQWKKGVRDVLFPEGTWWMRVFCHVHTEPIAGC